MNLLKSFLPPQRKFTPASDINWGRIETLVHGPGASQSSSSAGDTNSAVFACLMAISTAFPEPPLMVYKMRLDGNVKQFDGPLQDLLNMPTPNGEMTMDEMLFWTAWAKHTDGNAYWMKVRSGNAETGNVVELWPVSPTLMTPVSEGNDWISFYKYQDKPNHFVPVPLANVIHFRLGVDDKDKRLGLAPLKALVRQISTDEEADKFVDALLKNYAVPGLVVIPEGGTVMTEEDALSLTERMRRKFGTEGRGNIAVMSKESRIEQFGFTPEELNLTVLHRVPEERISAVMGVPAIVAGLGAGLERATLANARELGEWFTERKLVPQWRADARKLNIALKPDFYDNPRITIDFDTTNVRALQEDEDAKYKRLQIAVGKPWVTRNEARSDTGLDPIEGWDEEDIAPPPPPEPNPMPGDEDNSSTDETQEENADDQPDAGTGAAGAKTYRTFDVPFGGEEHKALFEKFVKRTDPHEKKFAAMVRKLMEQQAKDIVAGLKSMNSPSIKMLYKSADNPFNKKEWVGKFKKAAGPFLRAIIKDAGTEAMAELSLRLRFDVFDPSVIKFLEARAQRFAVSVNDTTWELLKKSLANGIEAGESIPELADRVLKEMGDRIRSSPETIARTEVIGASNGGTMLSWDQTDVVKGKTWLSALDPPRVRPAHEQAHGQTVALDEDFEVGGESLPYPGADEGSAENVINCRCTMTAVLK